MAVDAETVALIAAGGTAVGALVGATAGGVVDLALARLGEGREARVGARLVRADLAVAASQLLQAEKDGRWWVFFNTRMVGWASHRTALSAKLSGPDFETVTQSVMELERFGADMAQAPLQTGASFRVINDGRDSLHTMRENATAAYNVLAERAKGERVLGLLHDAT